MAAVTPSNPVAKVGETMEGEQNIGETPEAEQKLDAGALFVLKSKGSWLHCGYHLTTSIVAPALLSLPLALSMMGWAGSVLFLIVAAAVTFYSYALLSLVLEHHAELGHRLLRFRDMAFHVLGHSSNAPKRDYTIAGKMFKGLCLCYAVVVTTFLSVAISGYWAFGSQSQSNILSNFITIDGRTLVPKWFLMMTNIFSIVQIFAVSVVDLQPTNEVLEQLMSDPKKEQYSARNVVPRIIFRSLGVAFAALMAAMLPFFGDIFAVIGAFAILPLDFVVPAVMYNVTFRSSTARRGVLWFNAVIAIVFSVLTVLGGIASVRSVTLYAKNYKLFANV